jgi:DNA replication initiation complex subunit (GINS family)
MLSYNEIYSIVRQEKYNQLLQKLPKNFFEEVRAYMAEKKKTFEKEEFSDAVKKLKKQFENVESLLAELIEIRQKKIVNLAFLAKISGISKSDFENMLPEEKEFFDAVLEKMKLLDEKMKAKLREEKEEKKDLKKTCLIKLNADIDEFLDGEGNLLGPFKKGDIANLPVEIAEILINEQKATKLE